MNTSAPSACQPLEGALRIPVTLIEPSPLNPRKRWNPDKVAAMAADLKANAQIQPIRVRPNARHTASNGRPPYEIVVGETRWRAAPAAGLAMLDAVVADCTDHQLIQLALAENTKRQDLHPLEEADAFDALLRKPDGLQGYASVADLAAGVGVSASYVYQRLKLRALCPAGREAFLAGQIDASVALLIARMPNAEEQARATARIISGWGGEAYSFRQASEFLKREFMLQLQLARFDIAAAYKVAGPCGECPKRSGAAPDLFADVASAGDLCQDARCYKAKEEEAHQQLLQAAREAGGTVLQGAKARAVMPAPDGEPVGHYRLDAPCPALTDSGRTLRALLGSGFTGAIVVLDLPGVPPVELVPAEVARKAIGARRLLREQTTKAPPAARAPSPRTKDDAAPVFTPKAAPPPATSTTGPHETAGGEGQHTAEARNEGEGAAPAALPAMSDAQWQLARDAIAAEVFPKLLVQEMADALWRAEQLPLSALRAACVVLLGTLPAEACALVWLGMRWDEVGSSGYQAELQRHLRDMEREPSTTGRRLGELLCLLAAADDLAALGSPQRLQDAGSPVLMLCDDLAVDLQRLQRSAETVAGARLPARGTRSVAAAGRQEPADATEAWLQAHGDDAGAESSDGLAPVES